MPGLRIRSTFTFPYFSGSPDPEVAVRSALVPGKYNCAIDGRPYMIDQANTQWGSQSIARTRVQADNAPLPSERSLNPEGLWRRSQESWRKGAGQRFLDAQDSDPERFRTSKGIDPWTRGRLALLPATDQKRTSANTNLDLVPAGIRLYLLDGNALLYTTDITADTPTWTAVTTVGTALASPAAITSDGRNVYAIDGANVYYTTTSLSTYVTATGSPIGGELIRYVKGRLLIADGPDWSELSGTLGSLVQTDATPLLTHANDDWTWVDFVGGTSQIYAAGFSGDKSLIYRTAVTADGAALAPPVVAGELPDGELVRSLGFYLGNLLIGTDLGLRFAIPNAQGDLEMGQLLPTPNAVRCFEGQDRFVWFGWTNFDDLSTGLGRLDLSVFNELTPAYTSDLMVTGQGSTLDVVTFQNQRVFAVSGLGIFGQDTDLVPSGSIESGWFNYGITEPKAALFLDTQWAQGNGSFQASFAVDSSTFMTVGSLVVTTSATAGDTTFGLAQRRGRLFEVRYDLFRDANDATLGPILNRWTTRSQPAAVPGVHDVLPLWLYEEIVCADDSLEVMDPVSEREFLEEIHRETRVVLVQVGNIAYQAVIDDWQWMPYRQNQAWRISQEGTFAVSLKRMG